MTDDSTENKVKQVKTVSHSIPQWLRDNEDNFVPPVCNYMMHNEGRLKVMFVGGPNIRKDFHIEEGEEFFYMVKGDMTLVVMEGGHFRDVHIKEGEVFQLPAHIPHSPQRFEDTMGLVIERERMKHEMDCVRYHVEGGSDALYEEWFYCHDLGTQLGPLIRRYFGSQQHRTGQPVAGTITKSPPFVPDPKRSLQEPFHLMKWVNTNMEKIQTTGRLRLWDTTYQSDIVALGQGTDEDVATRDEETWLWQLVGHSTVIVDDGTRTELSPQDTLLIKSQTVFCHRRDNSSVCLSVLMPWANKTRAFQHLVTEEAKEQNVKESKK